MSYSPTVYCASIVTPRLRLRFAAASAAGAAAIDITRRSYIVITHGFGS